MDSITAAIEQQAHEAMQHQHQQQQQQGYNHQLQQHTHQQQQHQQFQRQQHQHQHQLNEPRLDLLGSLVQSASNSTGLEDPDLQQFATSGVTNGNIASVIHQPPPRSGSASAPTNGAVNLLGNLYIAGLPHVGQQQGRQIHQHLHQLPQQDLSQLHAINNNNNNNNKKNILPRARSRSATTAPFSTNQQLSSKQFAIDPTLNIGVGVIPDIMGPRLNLGHIAAERNVSNTNAANMLSGIPGIPSHPGNNANLNNNVNLPGNSQLNQSLLECTRCKKSFSLETNSNSPNAAKPFKLCPHCRDLQRERSRKWQQRTKQKKGACRRCGVQIPPSQSNFVLCAPCRLSLRSRKATRYEDGKCVHCSGENLSSEFKVCLRCRNNDRLRRKALEEKGCCNRCSRELNLEDGDTGHKVCLKCRERKKKNGRNSIATGSNSSSVSDTKGHSVSGIDQGDISLNSTDPQSLSDVIDSFSVHEPSQEQVHDQDHGHGEEQEDERARNQQSVQEAQRITSFEESLTQQQQLHQQQAMAMVQAAAVAQKQQQQESEEQQSQMRRMSHHVSLNGIIDQHINANAAGSAVNSLNDVVNANGATADIEDVLDHEAAADNLFAQ
ncbi:hypothetical protein WICPIJ_009238 [Wickerhamomyces pijperi]|uniref:Uncharacterized protein n=1 Tax=Wickerhamomyces pijperi TaxID=599730 RepID=A0A9P8TEM6_WICPI|nr:hypothetical protein WICPIJ_009238 [Wickerhamomyces pijperi]